MNNEKTIKQLADELGVSKDKVKYQVRKLPSELTTKIKGVTYLNNEAISIITVNLKGGKTGNYLDGLPKGLPSDYLVEQLKIKDEEISEKNKQLERMMDSNDKLQKLLDQQQILTLQANKKIEELELKNKTNEEMKSEDNNFVQEKNLDITEEKISFSQVEKEKKNSDSFWKKFFRKDK